MDDNTGRATFPPARAPVLAGMKLPEIFDAKLPLRVFTKGNVGETGTPPVLAKGYNATFRSDYEKLWVRNLGRAERPLALWSKAASTPFNRRDPICEAELANTPSGPGYFG